MNKQLYRKFKIKTVRGVDDFASMREVIHRRYRRLLDEIKAAMPKDRKNTVADDNGGGSGNSRH